ncbi:MAG: penicillin-binding protein activator LpoB [Gammaproteobacteria bacterium]|nr:penicillin-binding protein activator LpoB [Gammaproteobacteria bacterium]
MTPSYVKKLGIGSIVLLTSLVIMGCAPSTVYVDTADDRGEAVMALDYRDFESAAGEMVDGMLGSRALENPRGGRYVLVVSRIVNDTMQRIDTDQLVRKIRSDLLNSGRVVVTTAVGLDGPEDEMNMAVRQLRESGEFNQNTVQGEGQLIAPDLSLSGVIRQRDIQMDNRQQQVEYYFELAITDLSTGLAIWEDQEVIVKRGSNRAPTW